MFSSSALPRRTLFVVTVAAFLIGSTGGSVASASRVDTGRPSWVPAGVAYAPPPPGAPPEPIVPPSPHLKGVGDAPGKIIHPTAKRPGEEFPVPHRLLSGGSTVSRSTSSSCLNGYQYAQLYTTTTGNNPAAISESSTYVANLAVTGSPTIEHSNAGIIDWHDDVHQNFVQLGFQRGDSQTWTDNLPPGQSAIYFEFQTSGTYNWAPLMAANDYDRHSLEITVDSTGHYYDAYVDGSLEWANLYLPYPPDHFNAANEDYNVDGVCDPGLADNNAFSPALDTVRGSDTSGHAVGVPTQFGPWTSAEMGLISDLPGLGYQCGDNGPGRVYWYCGA
jgi:hypothetical protein